MSTLRVDTITDETGTGPVTASNGLNVTGTLAATSVTGDGSALTGLNAAELAGVLPAIDGSALTGISSTPTTADVLSATAGATAGAVGTYMFAGTTTALDYAFGATIAGSNLRPAGITSLGWAGTGNIGAGDHGRQNTAQTGTWRSMGRAENYDTGGRSPTILYGATLWLRIS